MEGQNSTKLNSLPSFWCCFFHTYNSNVSPRISSTLDNTVLITMILTFFALDLEVLALVSVLLPWSRNEVFESRNSSCQRSIKKNLCTVLFLRQFQRNIFLIVSKVFWLYFVPLYTAFRHMYCWKISFFFLLGFFSFPFKLCSKQQDNSIPGSDAAILT